ncbi:hypothetical protein NMG60_11000660 [Bertholletia excelsa]
MAANEASESRKCAWLVMYELANMISVPMSLTAVVRLNVADAIWQGGSNAPLSAAEILSGIGLPSGDPDNLQRILRLLASYGVFSEHLSDDGSERRYSLTEIGKALVTDESFSYGAYVLQHHQDALMRAWPLVHEAVVDPTTELFVKANGEPAYSYYGKSDEMTVLMKRAMAGLSVPVMKALLDGYDGFEGVERLVDVGGNAGDCLSMIMKKHPGVKEGVNFDLPEVVAHAPDIPGVTHVGGDMLKSIPAGDAIFMKWILSIFTDEECEAIMINCHKALPERGKLIVAEPVLPNLTDDSHRSRALLEGDIRMMTIYRTKSRHRTEEEYRQLGLSAGFPHFRSLSFDYFFTVLEFQK